MRKVESLLFILLLLFLPTQFGKHFWPPYAFILGQRIDYLSPTIYATDILILGLFLLSVTRVKGQGARVKNFLVRYFPLYALAFTLLFFNILFLQSPEEGFYGFVKLIEISFLTYYTNNFLRTTSKTISLYISFAIIFESVLAILQFFHGGSLDGVFYYFGERTFNSLTPGIANASIHGELMLRPYATFSHPNVLAGFLVIYMTLVISNFKFQISNLQKFFLIITLCVGSFALCLTLSRVAIIVWFLAIVSLIIYQFRKRLFTKKSLLVFNTVLGVSIVLLFVVSPLLPRFTEFSFQDESVVLRERLAIDAFKMLFAHPFFGVGLHNFLVALPSFDFTRSNVFTIQPVHNIFLLVGAETGFIGLWLAVSGVIWMYLRLIKGKALRVMGKNELNNLPLAPYPFPLILLSEVIILGQFDHYFLTIQQGQLLLGLVLGIVFANI